MAARRSSLAPSSISTSRQSSLAYKGCSEPLNDAALQFKLSKKVAELTLVVHMLFTRNHEREVELEATKEAYEVEINNIVSNFQNEISRLKTEIEMEKWKRFEEAERLSKEGDENMRKSIEKYSKKIDELTVENERLEDKYKILEDRYKNARDEKEQTQFSLNALQKERIAKEKAMERDRERIEKLQQNARVNKELMEKMKENIHSIQKNVNHKLSQMEASNRSSSELAEQLRQQNEQLETENRAIRKKVSDQAAQIRKLEAAPAAASNNSNNNQPKCRPSIPQKTTESDLTKDEEIERLRKQIQKYRLELSNREENFNKIFSEITPVNVMLRNGAISCVKDMDSEHHVQRIDSPNKNTEISIPSFKHRGISKHTLKLRAKLAAPPARSLLPSLSSPHSTPGELGKFSPLSNGASYVSRDTLRAAKTQPSSSYNLQPKNSQLADVRWIFGKKASSVDFGDSAFT